jgi:hypothetical protein
LWITRRPAIPKAGECRGRSQHAEAGTPILLLLESAVFWYYGADVSSVRDAKRSVTQAIQRAVCSLHLGEASPREFVVADEDLLPELVRDTLSPFSDLLETRACILGHPAAVRETKHI